MIHITELRQPENNKGARRWYRPQSPIRSRKRVRKLLPVHERNSYRLRLEVLEDRCLPSTTNVWVAPGSSGNWNTPTDWSLSHVPSSTEIAAFDGSSAAVCTIDAPAMGTNTVSGINITAAYMASVQDTADITVGSDGFVLAGASFTVTGNTTITVAGNWSANGPFFSPGTGTVNFNGGTGTTQLLDSGGSAFHNLVYSGAGTLNLVNNPLIINGTLDSTGGRYVGSEWTQSDG